MNTCYEEKKKRRYIIKIEIFLNDVNADLVKKKSDWGKVHFVIIWEWDFLEYKTYRFPRSPNGNWRKKWMKDDRLFLSFANILINLNIFQGDFMCR